MEKNQLFIMYLTKQFLLWREVYKSMNKQSSGFNFNVPSVQEGFDFQKPYVPLVLSENERKEVKEMEKIIKLWCKSCEKD